MTSPKVWRRKIFIVDVRGKQADGGVQAEPGQQTKLDHERREREEEQERSCCPREWCSQNGRVIHGSGGGGVSRVGAGGGVLGGATGREQDLSWV